MSEERLQPEDDSLEEEGTLSAEVLDKIAGGLFEERSKVLNNEQSRKN